MMEIEELLEYLNKLPKWKFVGDRKEARYLNAVRTILERVKRLEGILTSDEKEGYTDEQILALLRTGEEW